MNDNDIIKALREVARKYEGKPVATCETNISNMATDAADHIERLCDEIKRQQTEIERLREAYSIYEETTGLKQAKDDAIREFAERLKTELTTGVAVMRISTIDTIDNLVKEMTEEIK